MNLFICLHGIVGGKKGKNGEGGPWDPKTLYKHTCENIIEPNKIYYDNINFLIHSWSIGQKKEILNYYNPIKYCIEEPKIQDRRRSKLLSLYKSIQLCNDLTEDDIILHARFDNFYKKPLILNPSNIKKKEVYIASDDPNWDLNPQKHKGRICDYFFFGYGKQFFNNINSEKYLKIDNYIKEGNIKVCRYNQKGNIDNHTILRLVLEDFNIIKLKEYKSKININTFRQK